MKELDIERFAKENGRDAAKPDAQLYIIRIDRENRRVGEQSLSGREILGLVEKTPSSHKLFQKFKGEDPKPVAPDEQVSFVQPGIERFQTIPLDTTEGETLLSRRRDFELPESDREYFDNLGLAWDSLLDGQTRWILIHGYPIPQGYNNATVSVGLELSTSYPETQIDMVYFSPALARTDGKAIGALSNRTIAGQNWQRWSRHRTRANPWRRGFDSVETHLLLIDEWLQREFRKAA